MNRYLIVNADDFGLCHQVNAGIAAAHDRGIVTSASLMVRWPAAQAAAEIANARPTLAVGLHVDLGEWEPTPHGDWVQRWVVVDTTDADAVIHEVERQVSMFQSLTGSLPTHLDGHQHIQRDGPARAALLAAAAEHHLPLRLHDHRVAYRGDFYGQAGRGERFPEGISVANLVGMITSLPPGWTEMSCHPGIGVPGSLTSYAEERDAELRALCSEDVVAALAEQSVTLASFADLVTLG